MPLPFVVQAFTAIGRASLCVFTLKAAQPLAPHPLVRCLWCTPSSLFTVMQLIIEV